MRLDEAPWSAQKLLRKGTKQTVWLGIGLVTGFTFVGYFTPIRTLAAEAATLSFSPWEWFWVLFYGFATYGNAGYLREQVCKFMCPYARFQGALIDRDSMVIAYDTARGDPRGSRSRKTDRTTSNLGDCVDCTLCVQVCPTGIDIRNGLQNECIGCAACIDVCDDVMGKMGYAPGLIRYSTENGVAKGWTRAQMLRRVPRPRVLIYGALLLVTTLAFVISLAYRADFRVDVFRDRSMMARITDDGSVENVYQLHITNATEKTLQLQVQASGLPALRMTTPAQLTVEAERSGTLPLRLRLPLDAAESLRGRSSPIVFEVSAASADAATSVREKSTFFVPR
jgi:cytochrome c oxidase accessory protein FixG